MKALRCILLIAYILNIAYGTELWYHGTIETRDQTAPILISLKSETIDLGTAITIRDREELVTYWKDDDGTILEYKEKSEIVRDKNGQLASLNTTSFLGENATDITRTVMENKSLAIIAQTIEGEMKLNSVALPTENAIFTYAEILKKVRSLDVHDDSKIFFYLGPDLEDESMPLFASYLITGSEIQRVSYRGSLTNARVITLADNEMGLTISYAYGAREIPIVIREFDESRNIRVTLELTDETGAANFAAKHSPEAIKKGVATKEAINLIHANFYALEKSKRFDLILDSLFNNLDHSIIHPSISACLMSLLALCDDGTQALRSQGVLSKQRDINKRKILIDMGIAGGVAILSEDPISLCLALGRGYTELRENSIDFNNKVSNVWELYQHRFNREYADFVRTVSTYARDHNVQVTDILPMQTLREIDQRLARTTDGSGMPFLRSVLERHPRNRHLQLLLVKEQFYGQEDLSDDFFDIIAEIITSRGYLYHRDPLTLDAAKIGSLSLIIGSLTGAYKTKTIQGDFQRALSFLIESGLQEDPAAPTLRFARGYLNLFQLINNEERFSENSIMEDLVFEHSIDAGILGISRGAAMSAYAVILDTPNMEIVHSWMSHSFSNGAVPAFMRQLNPWPIDDKGRTILEEGAKIQWSWNIVFGIFNDDIIIKNRSPFPLTNIKVEGTIVNERGRYPFTIRIPHLGSDQAHTAKAAVSVRGNKLIREQSHVSLTSDQDP